jgi:predicted aspartyl protease
MPTFHIQVVGQGKTPDGKPVQVPPGQALQQRGPVIQVTVGLEQTMAHALIQQGKAIPPARAGLALIDTGASVSCIDEQAAQDMKLPVVDVGKMTSASHDSHPCNLYPIQIVLPAGIAFGAPRAMGASLAAQGLIAIIGRDILQVCTLFYNGNAGQITLSF